MHCSFLSVLEKVVPMEKVSLRSDEFKARWDSSNLRFERDRRYDLSWPQRNYNCTFCKKQFKSAQALGGHMNIHRRDRARLRQSTPWEDCPNSNPSPITPTSSSPNPNPNFSSSPSATTFFPYISHYSSLTSSLSSLSWNPSPASSVVDGTKLLFKDHCDRELANNGGGIYGAKLKSSVKKEEKKNESFLGFGLNMGLHKDVEEEGLDLELRLGYS